MKELGKGIEGKLGPGSDFEKKMKELGKDMEAKFGPGSDFEKKIKEQAEKLGSELQKKAARNLPPRKATSRPAPPKGKRRLPQSAKFASESAALRCWKPRSASSLTS